MDEKKVFTEVPYSGLDLFSFVITFVIYHNAKEKQTTTEIKCNEITNSRI